MKLKNLITLSILMFVGPLVFAQDFQAKNLQKDTLTERAQQEVVSKPAQAAKKMV